jgi:alpha-L-rhamnosidase
LADEVRDAYASTYLRPNGRLTSDSQTAYALTTVFDLWPDEESKTAGTARLAELVRKSGGAIATGFVGTPLVCDALTLGGYLAEAYQLLEHTECPSWLYPVLMGATTIWERWDSLTPDGLVNTGQMTSFNHYALGAVTDWLHRVVAGMEPAAPGYRHIRFAPRPGGTLTEAGARHITPYGEASIDWTLEGSRLSVYVSVPVGASATVELPDSESVEIRHGDHEFTTTIARPHA